MYLTGWTDPSTCVTMFASFHVGEWNIFFGVANFVTDNANDAAAASEQYTRSIRNRRSSNVRCVSGSIAGGESDNDPPSTAIIFTPLLDVFA